MLVPLLSSQVVHRRNLILPFQDSWSCFHDTWILYSFLYAWGPPLFAEISHEINKKAGSVALPSLSVHELLEGTGFGYRKIWKSLCPNLHSQSLELVEFSPCHTFSFKRCQLLSVFYPFWIIFPLQEAVFWRPPQFLLIYKAIDFCIWVPQVYRDLTVRDLIMLILSPTQQQDDLQCNNNGLCLETIE